MSTAAPEPGRPVAASTERPPQPPPRRPRPRQTARDMVVSLGVILACAAVVLLFLPRPQAVEQPPVDVAGAAAGAQQRVGFPVPVPAVPDGWTPNAARVDSGPDGVTTWVVGWVTPSEEYAGLRVAGSATERWVRDVTSAGTEEGVQDVDGEGWRVFSAAPERRSDPPRRALVREEGGTTTAVLGTAEFPELVELAAAVQAAPVG
ncbi:DUF4245 domain-containing protein [Pseudokineococcus sp. 5B2Z-1]|uniref:DUF4245 domain-containing protein n=1 Tax=Pseudokineococcus sp. 5B2Z-1 TaxID=3132744 RepID=UPI0030AC76A5